MNYASLAITWFYRVCAYIKRKKIDSHSKFWNKANNKRPKKTRKKVEGSLQTIISFTNTLLKTYLKLYVPARAVRPVGFYPRPRPKNWVQIASETHRNPIGWVQEVGKTFWIWFVFSHLYISSHSQRSRWLQSSMTATILIFHHSSLSLSIWLFHPSLTMGATIYYFLFRSLIWSSFHEATILSVLVFDLAISSFSDQVMIFMLGFVLFSRGDQDGLRRFNA